MSTQRINAVEKDLEKFIKFLALKSTQVVVLSRLGEKMQTHCNPLSTGSDWFNLEIQDHPDVSKATKCALALGPNASILQRLPLCVEISVKTVEGDQMVLEVWSLDVTPPGSCCNEDKDVTDAAILKGVSAANGTANNTGSEQLKASHAIYNRMGMLLKSLISLTRVTPAYKLSRRQCPEAYGIYYRIYVDQPQVHLLGDGCKFITIGELNTIVGTLKMEVSYRTKMTISPTTAPTGQTRTGETNTIMLKSDHFRPNDNASTPTQNTGLNVLAFGKKGLNGFNGTERKMVDIEKPLKPGAFVDLNKLRQYTEEDYILPETPPFEWILRRNRNESDGSGSLESLNRKSESPASSPLSATGTSNNSTNNNNATGLNNQSSNSNNNTSNNININNNVPAFKSLESNGEKPTTTPITNATTVVNIATNATAATTAQTTQTTKSASPANVPTKLSQSPLKSLLVPAQITTKRHSSTPNLPPGNGCNIPTMNDEDNLLRELNFPFASPSSHVNELAKFYRDCYHAPPLRSLTTETQPEVNNTTNNSSGNNSSNTNNSCNGVGCGAAAVYANIDSSDFAVIDDMSRQLEQFETSLEDYDKLVSSLTGSSSTGSRSSGGGLQMSN